MRNWFFDYVFPIFFSIVMIGALSMFVFNGYLVYQCYQSNDPNSTACFMVHSNQQTINLNERRS